MGFSSSPSMPPPPPPPPPAAAPPMLADTASARVAPTDAATQAAAGFGGTVTNAGGTQGVDANSDKTRRSLLG